MPEKHSSKRVVSFMLNLWRIAPVMTSLMVVSQIIFAVLTTTIAPIFVSQLLTQIAAGTATLQSSIGLLIGYGLILIVGDVIAIRVTIALAFLAESRMQAHVALVVMKNLTDKSMTYHSNKMSGGIVSDNNKLNSSIERFWDTLIFTAVPIATTLLSVCIALSFLFWQYAVALAILSTIVIIVIIKAQSSIAPISRAVAEKSSANTGFFADVISNISAVKAFAGERAELKEYKKKVAEWRQANLKEMKSVLIITGSFGVLMVVMNFAAFTAAILATQYQLASIGVVYLVISYTLNVVAQLWSVGNTTRSYIRIMGDAGPMIATLDEPSTLTDNKKPKAFNVSAGAIQFDTITFTHDENNEALFHDFNLDIKAGQKVGLVGPSGSGKTSLTKLLLRFSDVESGQVLIDGQAINAVRQSDLHSAIAYVPQEPILFHRSLRDNIAYGKTTATDDEVINAAKLSHSYEFIKKLPNGFETMVGERGVKLSGGQRQRIAIARAILKDAPIIVLDEATSALDSESEKLIQDSLTTLMAGRTSIVIAHRLSTIAKLDRIIVLDQGRITEDDTHVQLIKKNGTYARLWAHQSGGFIEE
ncbi:ABC transporter ATP-binding protein [Candidatus Saccharibacteria bacterium]|nr:ABC transporter ATP-binding protein [Candidatus Saccharibacteria bacterium]